MRTIFRTIFMGGLMLLAACKADVPVDSPSDGEEAGTEDQPELTIAVGSDYLESRSQLTSSEGLQHIESMYAYVFAPDAGSDETCVYVQKLEWVPASEANVQNPFRTRLKFDTRSYSGKELTVMVVAVDNNEDTYNFPNGEATDHDDLESLKDLTLNQAKLKLAQGKSGDDMCHTEIFAGWQKFEYGDQSISVTLNRCVAGVLCYVTDIPAMSGEKKATTMRLCLRTEKLRTEFSLKPVTKEVTQPDGSQVTVNSFYSYATGSTVDEQTLASCDLSGYETREDGRLLYIPAMDNGEVKTKENSVLLSAYLLPLESAATSSPENSTLVLYLDYADANGGNTESKEYKIVLGRRETERYAYSLEANRIYSIGSKPVSDEVESDRPASLEGTSIELNVMDWGVVDFTTEYPQYSLDTRMVVPYNTENYIFDCINTTFTMRIIPSSNTGAWTLTSETMSTGLVQETNPMNFIYFRKAGTTDSWADHLDCSAEEAKNPMDVEVLINDFVADRSSADYGSVKSEVSANLAKDYRTAELVLTEGSKVITTRLKQYNAIIIETNGNKVGFRRLDYMQDFDLSTGMRIPITEKGSEGEGFKGCNWLGFYGTVSVAAATDKEDGYKNYKKLSGSDDYGGSAFEWVCVTAKEWNGSQDLATGDKDHWYLPARDEMENFFQYINAYTDRFVGGEGYNCTGILESNWYWTSTMTISSSFDNKTANIAVIENSQVKISEGLRRTGQYYYRQARHL